MNQCTPVQFHLRTNTYRKQVHQFHDDVTTFILFHNRCADALFHRLLPVVQIDSGKQILVTGVLSVHQLRIIADCRFHLRIIEINQVRTPLYMSALCQERSVGGHGNDVAIAFHRR